MSHAGLKNVVWVNQSGRRGVGRWTDSEDRKAQWEVRGIPLRPGINLITVTAVDANNRSASLLDFAGCSGICSEVCSG